MMSHYELRADNGVYRRCLSKTIASYNHNVLLLIVELTHILWGHFNDEVRL